MSQTVLIANRGEIACRIIRTAQRMGFQTVAVYSDADRTMPHVKQSDRAVHIGPSPAAESYLVIDKIIQAAQQTGATMIHPGYGFLSENTDFAQACADAGILFVGAPANAIKAMGLKDAAKDLMAKAGVPVVPGYNGEDQDPARLHAAANEIGYPVMIKAVAGGGGKGMRIVEAEDTFLSQLEACKGEALRAFGNDHVLIEKFINAPRHVEVQVFSDTLGNHVHLFDRDCSIQRRHQKIIEEAPAPGIPDNVRTRMYEAAVQAAKAVDYVGAGTIEFIMDAESFDFYFMEMNTRLQVEHPVTEEITGIDLVEWQLRVTLGEPLPLQQQEITQSGHAIEVRLYAEDAEAGFLPSTGRLERLWLHSHELQIRLESGVEENQLVTPFYDPMIAKIIASERHRGLAIDTILQSLDGTLIEGLKTNRAFLGRVLRSDAFHQADLTTAFLTNHSETITPPSEAPEAVVDAAAIAACVFDPNWFRLWTPWDDIGPVRLNGPLTRTVTLQFQGASSTMSVSTSRLDREHCAIEGRHYSAFWPGSHWLDVNGVRYGCMVRNDHIEIRQDGQTYVFTRPEARHGKDAAGAHSGAITAPMPGNILSVAVSEGDAVEAGATLLVLEAMKMEHRMAATKAGVVKTLHVAAGAQVQDGDVLVEIGEEG